MRLWKGLKGKVKLNQPLSQYTTMKIGGRVKYFFEPKDICDLMFLIKNLRKYRIAYRVIGAGGNILASDTLKNQAVIRFSSVYFNWISFDREIVSAGSGLALSCFLSACADNGLGGAHFLAGIPATIGGALSTNAGSGKESISKLVKEVTVLTRLNKIKTLNINDIKFSYRRSGLSKYIILSAKFKLKKENKLLIRKNISDYLADRKLKQDICYPSAGCIFKNPKNDYAARLIDLCGLKGLRAGGAGISHKHANFIINLKAATFKDVLNLICIAKKSVKDKFNISLESEVIIWR